MSNNTRNKMNSLEVAMAKLKNMVGEGYYIQSKGPGSKLKNMFNKTRKPVHARIGDYVVYAVRNEKPVKIEEFERLKLVHEETKRKQESAANPQTAANPQGYAMGRPNFYGHAPNNKPNNKPKNKPNHGNITRKQINASQPQTWGQKRFNEFLNERKKEIEKYKLEQEKKLKASVNPIKGEN